ncbi:2'-5'-oligoadenylate synthase 1-like isoform X2 [Montipora capricornis]|uniref:2'-5'-oligoadenylate synthase 1-like isoform X2 n=1 Tax=Montipora capricornis TaxID=246305 RepID=UPI0035F1ED8A
MSESHIRFSNCLGRNFLLEDVERVMSERGTEKGSRRVRVQCCVQGCSRMVRKLRLHIRKFHEKLCPLACSDCNAKFVGPRDLANHHRNGCPPRRKQIETFFEKCDFSNSSAVNKFITKDLQLDEASRSGISEVVDLLYKHLQHNLPQFSINKLVKGGSVGKGTAVKDKADIDCVVFLNNVKTMGEHKRNLQNTKNRLELCLKQSPYKDRITFGKQTPFAVKFHFRLDLSREFDIDLLPAFTTYQSREQLYKEIIDCTTQDRAYYSAGLVEYQVDFVKGQPAIVKNLIRLVKYWRKTCIEDKSGGKTRLPSSYPLELITIHCWEEAEKPNSFDIRVGFKAVLQQLVDYCNINVRWHKYYSEDLANRGIEGMTMSEKSRPFVLDPANPTNNVCSASDAEGWKTVADVAKMTLERQPLRDVIVTRDWQI